MSIEPADPIDDLCQISDELRVIWLALNGAEGGVYITSIANCVNEIDHRLRAVIENMINDVFSERSGGGAT